MCSRPDINVSGLKNNRAILKCVDLQFPNLFGHIFKCAEKMCRNKFLWLTGIEKFVRASVESEDGKMLHIGRDCKVLASR